MPTLYRVRVIMECSNDKGFFDSSEGILFNKPLTPMEDEQQVLQVFNRLVEQEIPAIRQATTSEAAKLPAFRWNRSTMDEVEGAFDDGHDQLDTPHATMNLDGRTVTLDADDGNESSYGTEVWEIRDDKIYLISSEGRDTFDRNLFDSLIASYQKDQNPPVEYPQAYDYLFNHFQNNGLFTKDFQKAVDNWYAGWLERTKQAVKENTSS